MKLTESEKDKLWDYVLGWKYTANETIELIETILTAHVEQAEYKTERHIYMRWKHMCRNYRAIGMCDELGNNCQFEKCPLLKETK